MTPSKNRKDKKQALSKASWLGWLPAILLFGILPLVYSTKTLEPVIYPRFTALGLSVIILWWLGLIYKNKGQKIPSSRFGTFETTLFVFAMYSGISLFWATNPVEGISDVLKWFVLFFLTLALQTMFARSNNVADAFAKIAVVAVAIALFVGGIQFFQNYFGNNDPNALYEVKGLMAHRNQFSIFLFLMIPWLMYAIFRLNSYWKSNSIWFLACMLLMLLVLQTRAVWAALLLVFFIFLVFLLVNGKKFNQVILIRRIRLFVIGSIGGLVLLVLVGFFVPDNHPLAFAKNRVQTISDPKFASNEWRIEMWQATFEMVADNPLQGVGAGNWKIEIYPYYSPYLPSVYKHWRAAHNDFLEVAAEKGLPGLMLYLMLIISLSIVCLRLVIRSKKPENKLIYMSHFGILTGFAVVSFFSFPMARIFHWVLLTVNASFLLHEYRKSELEEKGMFSIRWYNALKFVPLIVLLAVSIFGVQAILMEINIAKAQQAKERNQWNQVLKWAQKTKFPLAPLEPKFSFPVVMYEGLGYFHTTKHAEAKKYFEEALKQHPNHVSVLNNVGSAYASIKEFNKAKMYFEQSIEIFKHYEIGLLNLTKTYYLLEDYESAYQTLLRCSTHSNNPEIEPLKKKIEQVLPKPQP